MRRFVAVAKGNDAGLYKVGISEKELENSLFGSEGLGRHPGGFTLLLVLTHLYFKEFIVEVKRYLPVQASER